MAKITVHCGFHKTGSTYIQETIESNRGHVEDVLTLFNREAGETAKVRRTCIDFAMEAPGVGEADVVAAFRSFLPAIERRRDRPALLTDESFVGPQIGHLVPMGPRGVRTLGIYPRFEAIAACMLEAFAGHETRLFFYTRNEEPWIDSLYNQVVKHSRLTMSKRAFRALFPEDFAWSDLAARLHARVDPARVTFCDMAEDAGTRIGVGTRLLREAGLPEERLARLIPVGRKNVSVPEDRLNWVILLNRLNLNDRLHRRLRKVVLST